MATFSTLCGNLIVGGFASETLSSRFEKALRAGERAGAILFRRNLPTIEVAAALCESLYRAAESSALPPIVGIDQEGGRVRRLPEPALCLPPMRVLGQTLDVELIEQASTQVAAELFALGFNLNFAPVLDVDSNPNNPVIGDRAFGGTPEQVILLSLAWIARHRAQGVMSCGKHFPGHGDTSVDSHKGLPVVAHERERLERLELLPFRAACAAKIEALMTAHIVCEAFDKSEPSTFSKTISTDLLRGELGFGGVLFSDDMEMRAVADRYGIEDGAVLAIEAGCDALLICSDEDLQDRAHGALVKAAERDVAFRRRCEEASRRVTDLRKAQAKSRAARAGGRLLHEMHEVFGSEAARRLRERITELMGSG